MDGAAPGYRIGTVAGLTGLDPHTIRAWERRHRAVEPQRAAGGQRLYGDAAIERLQLLKALVDCGEPIGRIARHSDGELRDALQRLAGLRLPERQGAAGPQAVLRTALLAPALEAQLAASGGELAGLRLAVRCADKGRFLEELRRTGCDLLIVELEALGRDPLGSLDGFVAASHAQRVIVLYSFATRALLARLARRGCRPLRGPLGLDQLQRSIADLLAGSGTPGAPARPPAEPSAPARAKAPAPAPTQDDAPPRRFDDASLARISQASTALDCECPQHLSDLVRSLVAFERYSRECESRDPEDALVHRRLAGGTARARSTMEDLLEALCAHEQIEA